MCRISRPAEAPNIADIFPQVRQMLLDGKYHEAARFAYEKWHETPSQGAEWDSAEARDSPCGLSFRKAASVKDYLRTVDFESTEVKVHWTDERGEWVRQTFASRPDNVVVQWLTAPKGQSVNVRITVAAGGGRRARRKRWPGAAERGGGGGGQGNAQTDFNEQRLIFKGILDPSVNNSGYAGVTRVVRDGGSARMDGDTLVIENASSVMLLTRIEYFPDYSEEQVEALRQAVEELTPDYPALLERARKVQSEMLNRVTVDFGGASQIWHVVGGTSVRSAVEPGLFGRFSREVIRDVPLLVHPHQRQVLQHVGRDQCQHQPADRADGVRAITAKAWRPTSTGWRAWSRTSAPTRRTFSACAAPIIPSRRAKSGASKPCSTTPVRPRPAKPGRIPTGFPPDGWCVRPFWDHYLVTGDLDFLRKRVVPAYKDLALFYEDFLTVTDKDGNYIFVPSFSPENNPGNLNPSCMLVINASMDISVCREVLANLVEACELLGIEADSVPKWKAMLAKLPPYLLEPDGAMKEWAWPTLARALCSAAHFSSLRRLAGRRN